MAPKQLTLASEVGAGFALHRKATRRDVFLAEMDKVVPWSALCALIEPHYPKAREDGAGRRPLGLERMLRIHFLQQWYALSDPGVEEALYDSEVMRRFVGIDLGREGAPDQSTVLQFRHSLERHGLAKQILTEVNGYLVKHGMKLSRGAIVDATIIAATPSTKNQDKARDREMHQTKKGNQWYFGMKAHIGVDVNTGLVHTVTATAANVPDVVEVPNLLRGNETSVYGDAGYIGADKRVPKKRGRDWFIAAKRGKIKATEDHELRDTLEQIEHKKASVRARVEHPFRIVKRQFGYLKVRYRGLAKNGAQVMTLFALANLWVARRMVLAATGWVRPKSGESGSGAVKSGKQDRIRTRLRAKTALIARLHNPAACATIDQTIPRLCENSNVAENSTSQRPREFDQMQNLARKRSKSNCGQRERQELRSFHTASVGYSLLVSCRVPAVPANATTARTG